MNRLILIGNGFDLAHGMKTSYGDFIEWCWVRVSNEMKNEKIQGDKYFKDMPNVLGTSLITIISQSIDNDYNGSLRIVCPEESIDTIILEYLLDFTPKQNIQRFIKTIIRRITYSYDFWNNLKPLDTEWATDFKKEIQFKNNEFFIYISQNYVNKNWSDVEADYYRLLLKYKDEPSKIQKLNKEFQQIKRLLAIYLKTQQAERHIDKLIRQIYSPILLRDISLNAKSDFIKDVERANNISESSKQPQKIIVEQLERIQENYLGGTTEFHKFSNELETKSIFPKTTMMLNFNYTPLLSYYQKKSEYYNPDINHIHGTLASVDSMIFGYGDEEAKEYSDLENSEVRGLLDNVKSINYLNSRNYRDFERFIESEPFQVFIFGMSCGLADRTMLRKVFEHDNCVGIKPFYYAWENEETGEKGNNYSELVQNISRCFSDKNKLRSRVVNFEDCEAMPQWKKDNN